MTERARRVLISGFIVGVVQMGCGGDTPSAPSQRMSESGGVTSSARTQNAANDIGAGAPIGASRRPLFTSIAANLPPNMIVATQPRAQGGNPYPVVSGPAPLTVTFNLCRSDDPDQRKLPNGDEDPSGDSLNWQFHFGDGRPISNGPDIDHICRVEHTYGAGEYTATVSVTDKHQEDQSDFTALARATQKLTIVATAFELPSAPTSQLVCGGSISSSLNAAGPLQNGRIFRDAIPSVCPAKAYPGAFNVGTNFAYNTFAFSNPTAAAACVQVNFDPAAGATPCNTNGHASAYLNAYDPSNQAAGFLGDVGSSLTQSFNFQVPAGANFIVVVTNTAAAATCTFQFSVVIPGC